MAGDAAGLTDDRPYARSGGLGIFIDGALIGVRPNVNFQSAAGASFGGSDDPPNDRVNINVGVAAETQIGIAQNVNLLPGGALAVLIGTLAAGVEYQVTRIVVIARNVSGVAVQPTIEAGTDAPGNPPNNDLAASQALTLTATGQAEELTLAALRTILDDSAPNNIARVRQTGTPTATTYTVDVIAYGTVL